jgi:hypothetical protein
LFRCQGERNIILAERESLPRFDGVSEEIETSLAEVSVLGSVINGMVLELLADDHQKIPSTYMIPKRTCSLPIGIVVVLVGSNWDDIFCPSIPWGMSFQKKQLSATRKAL